MNLRKYYEEFRHTRSLRKKTFSKKLRKKRTKRLRKNVRQLT